MSLRSSRIPATVQVSFHFASALLHSVLAFFRGQSEQAVVELALRQQLAIYARTRPRPRVTAMDRAFWLALRRLWPRWKEALVVVKPETVVRWHRKGFHLYWRGLSRRGPGRPRIPQEVQKLIHRLALENGWGARKIQGELAKLGISVGLATVSRYLPRRLPDPGKRQSWRTFLRNHKDAIAAMDFFVVPSLCFQPLYVWFVIDHARRRLIHYNVTSHPTARWVIQQLREAFPFDRAPRYLLLDRDSIFSAEVIAAIKTFETDPVRTAYHSPWQNGIAERWIGSCRRELLDHVIVFGERHLRRLLTDYVVYYNADRVHTRLRDAPDGRRTEPRSSPDAKVVGLPRIGGLHHRYVWRDAA